MAYIYSLADTWTASGTTFTGIGLNVTDTASAAASMLMDLQVGGSSKFSVNKSGQITAIASGSTYLFQTDVATWAFSTSGFGGVPQSAIKAGTFQLSSSGSFAFSSGSSANGTMDTILARDAANTLAQRNGVNAQAFNLYNTYTDASNYERGFMRWVGGSLQIGAEGLGTGSSTASMRISMGVSGTLLARYINNANNSVTMFDLISDGTGTATYALGGSAPLLRFGGTTSSFPALKRSTTSMQVRLADDSAFTNIQGKLTTDTAYTAGAPTATGYIVLFDSTGTAYRVPAVAN